MLRKKLKSVSNYNRKRSARLLYVFLWLVSSVFRVCNIGLFTIFLLELSLFCTETLKAVSIARVAEQKPAIRPTIKQPISLRQKRFPTQHLHLEYSQSIISRPNDLNSIRSSNKILTFKSNMTIQDNNQNLIQLTDDILLTLTLKITTAWDVETSAPVNNSPSQDYLHWLLMTWHSTIGSTMFAMICSRYLPFCNTS